MKLARCRGMLACALSMLNIGLGAAFVVSCQKTDQVKLPQKVEKLSDDREAEADADNACLFVRNSAPVDTATEPSYRHVGAIGPYDVNLPETPMRARCNAVLIRPNIAITTQLVCVSQLDLSNITDEAQMVFSLSPNDISQNRSIKQIIRWREDEAAFRNVAMIVLDEPVGDETLLPYHLRQTPVANDEQLAIAIAGNGPYVDTALPIADQVLVEDGLLRSAVAQIVGKIDVIINAFQSEVYDPTLAVDHLQITADGTAALPCMGNRGTSDYGSPALQMSGGYEWLLGLAIATDGALDQGDIGKCRTAANAFYTPIPKIGPWIRSRVEALNPHDIIEQRILVKATVDEIFTDPNTDTFSLSFSQVIDDGLALEGDAHVVKFCKTGCLPQSQSIGDVEIAGEYLFEIIRVEETLTVKSVRPVETARAYAVDFDATVFQRDAEPRNVYSRIERSLTLHNVIARDASVGLVPLFTNIAQGIECHEGCSKTTEVVTEGFSPTAEQGVHILGDVIDGRLYIRSIEKNDAFDAANVQAELDAAAAKKRQKKKKKSCGN